MGLSSIEEKRTEVREQIIGEISWSYSSGSSTPDHKGGIVDFSASGLGILTSTPLRAGDQLNICCTGLWDSAKHATVRWCKKMAPNTYRSGLLKS